MLDQPADRCDTATHEIHMSAHFSEPQNLVTWSCELRWVAAVAPCSVMDEDWPVQSCRTHSCIQMSCRLMERELCPERDAATVTLRWISVQLELTNCLLRHAASVTVSSTCKH